MNLIVLLFYIVLVVVGTQQHYVVSFDSSSQPKTTTISGRLYFPLLMNRTTNEYVPFNGTGGTKITLNHGVDYITYSRPDGSFVIRNVKPGVHVIDIQNVIYHFPQIKCQYKPENNPAVTCLEYVFPGAPKQSIEVPLKIFAVAEYEYFEQRKGFSIWWILKNPMVLMMGFTVGMMFLMPKLMEGMDDEERARVQKQMEMQKDPTKMLGELWGSITGTEEETTPSPAKSNKIKKR